MLRRKVVRTRKHDLLGDALEARDGRRLRQILARLDPVQIAGRLDNLPSDERLALLQYVEPSRRAEVLEAMRYEAAADVVERLAPDEAARLLDELEADDAVDILGRLDPEQLEEILSRLDAEDADELQDLLAYDENTAGGIMSPEVFRCTPDATIGDVLTMLRSAPEVPESSFYVYVVEADGKLIGQIALHDLVTHDPETKVEDVMDRDVVAVRADMDQEEVADVVGRYDLVSVPVVDEHYRLLGRIDVDDILDVMREEATEDILKMAGAGEELVEAQSLRTAVKVRSRWLSAAALGGLFAAVNLAQFEHELDQMPALAFFMPVVAGMGGNVGTQSATIVVRGLAVGYIGTDRLWQVVLREMFLGAAMGFIYGLVVGAVAVVLGGSTSDPWHLAAVIALGMLGSMTLAAAVGAGVPLLLHRLDVDPAVATGPFVTTTVDVAGLLMYFAFARWLLGLGG
ncbi:MAG: magnesium transporter [Deltaproteobacteria bacterium]|nr:MAG: magnesium transporter [Deltaproteobacteria bacterium]